MKLQHREANARKRRTKPQPTATDIQALEAARLKIAQHIATKAEPTSPRKVQAIPATPGAKREDNSPYRKESRK